MEKKDLEYVDEFTEVFVTFSKQFEINWEYKIIEILKNETHYFIELEIYMKIEDQRIFLTKMSASFDCDEYKKITEENFNQFIMTGVARNIISGFQLIKSFEEQKPSLNDLDKPQIIQN